MGFFDDLEDEIGRPPPGVAPDEAPEPEAVGRAIDRIAGGTPWEGHLTPPPRKGHRDDVGLEQWTRIVFEQGRFVVTNGVARDRKDRFAGFTSTSVVRLDRAGLVEMLRNQPLVARRLVESIGLSVDPTNPDGRSALDALTPPPVGRR